MRREPVPENRATEKSKHVYRVDKFVVPAGAREEFLEKVLKTHVLLRTQSGFVQDVVLEQSGGPGEFNIVTIVEWDSADQVENARAVVMAVHQQMKFNPQEMVARLGIKADIADYRRIDF